MPDPLMSKPFDLDHAKNAIGEAVFKMVELSLRGPGPMPGPAEGKELMDSIRAAITAGSEAITEVSRYRSELSALRDGHRPQPHANPDQPGALCAACSVHGSIVPWPCATWSAAERILTHGRA